MKSDVIRVMNSGEGMEAALRAASASAEYRGLPRKEAIRVRLLAEEMLGMLRQIAGETEADFWAESEGKSFELHLTARPLVTGKMRRELLAVSSSGKNAAAVGVMGKLRDVFEQAFAATDFSDPADYSRFYLRGLVLSDAPEMDTMGFAMNAALRADTMSWSMQRLRESVEREKGDSPEAREEWDELEKSIVASIADEVKIAITGNAVEMTVYKKFD